jgi:uncharacterized membrane protein
VADQPDDLEPLSPEIARETERELQVMMASYSYSGPLPHPEIIRMYNEIVPNAADRIIAQFEAQSEHRRAMETRESKAGVSKMVFGQISGFLLGVLGMGGGIFLVHEGRSISGFSAFFAALASLVGIFVVGRIMNDRAERRESARTPEERSFPPPQPATKPKNPKPKGRKRS